MLNLNIKSSSYMCLDINQHSILDKHLAKKVTDLTEYTESTFNKIISKECPEDNHDHHASKHNLTMLLSFHISLGRPPQTKEELKVYGEYKSHTIDPKKVVPIIGDITLAPINISEKHGKKSAWIPLDAQWFVELFRLSQDPSFYPEYELNLNYFKPYPYDENYEPSRTLHISLANLTGNPRDSIARPEDCIIDTITA